MSWEYLQKIPEFLHFGWSDLAKVLIGAFMVVFMAVGWVRSIRKATKAQNKAEDLRRSADSAKEQAEFHSKIADLKSQHTTEILRLREQVMEAERGRSEAEAEREKMTATVAAMQRRLSDLESFDGKLWEQDMQTSPPPFITATDRQTRFISVVNLKGGVGKTTLTANIGVSLARRKHRVLLVDLDFQSSLTRLCKTSNEQLLELIRKRKTAVRLLGVSDEGALISELAHGLYFP